VKLAGKVDIVLHAAGPVAGQYGNGKLAVNLPIEEFMVLIASDRARMLTGTVVNATARAALD
jgi:hypothetical protein